MNLNVIVTMAGQGKRFKDVGVNVPKYQIEAKGRTLFEWSVASLQNFFSAKFIFVCLRADKAASFISDKACKLGISNFVVKELDHLTTGQATTAAEASDCIDDAETPIIIYNIDTYVEPSCLHPKMIRGEGWLPAFSAEGDRWSFVKFDMDYKVSDVREKVRISDYGTIGLYYFSSFNLFMSSLECCKFSGYSEKYVAPLYNELIKNPKWSVYTDLVPETSVHVLGTPEELMQFCEA